MLIDDNILAGCISGKRHAQNLLYQKYSPKMLPVCMRYSRNMEEAEDLLMEAFFKVFQKIKTYQGKGTIESWIKRIMINHAIDHLRKIRNIPITEDLDEIIETVGSEEEEDEMLTESPVSPELLISLIQSLPDGYKMVLNMFVFEHYSHKEIAEMLDISVNTSKTQLLKARRFLKERIEKSIHEKP